MPAVRIPMRQVVEALRLTYDQGRSQREIARALGVSQSTISEYRSRFAASGLPWPLPAELDEAALEARLYPPTPHALVPRPEPGRTSFSMPRRAPMKCGLIDGERRTSARAMARPGYRCPPVPPPANSTRTAVMRATAPAGR